jgi:hypothetical protein
MKWILLAIVCLLPRFLKADDHLRAVDFYHRYVVMCEMATGDEEAKEAAFELMKIDLKTADFVGAFWRQKALHSNQFALSNLDQIFEAEFKRANGDESKVKEAKKNYEENLGLHFVIYYYDHAEEIKKMIKLRLERAAGNEAAALPLPGVKDP